MNFINWLYGEVQEINVKEEFTKIDLCLLIALMMFICCLFCFSTRFTKGILQIS